MNSQLLDELKSVELIHQRVLESEASRCAVVTDDGLPAVFINLCEDSRWSFFNRLLLVEELLCWQVVLVHLFPLLLFWAPWMFFWDLVA